jgi:hypothetical protein
MPTTPAAASGATFQARAAIVKIAQDKDAAANKRSPRQDPAGASSSPEASTAMPARMRARLTRRRPRRGSPRTSRAKSAVQRGRVLVIMIEACAAGAKAKPQ